MTASTMLDILRQAGLADDARLSSARRGAEEGGMAAAEWLIRQNMVNEDELAAAVAAATGHPLVSLRHLRIPSYVAKLTPLELSARRRFIPVSTKREGEAEVVYVAFFDPTDAALFEEIRAIVGRPVKPAVAPLGQVIEALERYARPSRRPAAGSSSSGSSASVVASVRPAAPAPVLPAQESVSLAAQTLPPLQSALLRARETSVEVAVESRRSSNDSSVTGETPLIDLIPTAKAEVEFDFDLSNFAFDGSAAAPRSASTPAPRPDDELPRFVPAARVASRDMAAFTESGDEARLPPFARSTAMVSSLDTLDGEDLPEASVASVEYPTLRPLTNIGRPMADSLDSVELPAVEAEPAPADNPFADADDEPPMRYDDDDPLPTDDALNVQVELETEADVLDAVDDLLGGPAAGLGRASALDVADGELILGEDDVEMELADAVPPTPGGAEASVLTRPGLNPRPPTLAGADAALLDRALDGIERLRRSLGLAPEDFIFEVVNGTLADPPRPADRLLHDQIQTMLESLLGAGGMERRELVRAYFRRQ